MILQMIVPGVDQYLSKGIQQLGETLSLFFETDRKTQRAIRNMLLQNPKLVQDFADLEYRSPGSLKKLGFGGVANMVSKIPPSFNVQREERLGEKALTAEDQELGFRLFTNSLVQSELDKDPTLSALEVGALVNERLGIPRTAQLERENTDLITAQTNLDRLQRVQEAAAGGRDIRGAIRDYAVAHRLGALDSSITSTIYADPVLAPQFDDMLTILENEENRALQRELFGLRQSATNVSAVTKREVDFASDIKYSIGEARRLLQERPQGVGARYIVPESLRAIASGAAGIVSPRARAAMLDPEGVPLRQAISEINTTLFHLRSGTAVTANEKKRLEPYTPNIWDAPDVVAQKLTGLDRFFDEYIARRQQITNDPTVDARLKTMIDEWIEEGLDTDEILRRYNAELTKIIERTEIRR